MTKVPLNTWLKLKGWHVDDFEADWEEKHSQETESTFTVEEWSEKYEEWSKEHPLEYVEEK